MFEITHPSSKGTTTHAIRAKTKLTSGAKKKTTLSDSVGTIISLKTCFNKSAKLCNIPKGPTTLGPLLNCNKPQTFLSPYIMKAKLANTHNITKKHWPKTIMKIPKFVSKNGI